MSTPMTGATSSLDDLPRVDHQDPGPSTSAAGARDELSHVPHMNDFLQMDGMSVMMQGLRVMVLNTVENACKDFQAKNNHVQAAPEPAQDLIPSDPHIDMTLAEPEDATKLHSKWKKEILEDLHKAGGPWVNVVDVQIDLDFGRHHSLDAMASRTHERRKRMRLILATAAGEEAVRKVMNEISLILGLSPNCGMILPLYYVRIVGYVQVEGRDTRQYLDMWCRELHGVDVVNHFWTFRKLILAFENLEHAKKLCRDGVIIRGKPFTVQPFDRRAIPMFCFKCFRPGHFHLECKSDAYRCGRCAGAHDIQGCPKTTPWRCPNCSKQHPAWSEDCRFPDTLIWRSKAKAYFIRGPDWSHDPRHFSAPQQATKLIADGAAPKARGGKSSKTPKAAPSGSKSTVKKRLRGGEFVQDDYTHQAALKQAAERAPQPSNITRAEPDTPATVRF